MSDNLDFFDDLFAPTKPKARVVGKFQPKIRPRNVKMPPVPSLASKDVVQTVPLTWETHPQNPGIELQLDGPKLQPCQAANSCPVAPDHHATQEYMDQPEASVSEPLASSEHRAESLHHDHQHGHDSGDLLIPGSITVTRQVGDFKQERATSSKGKNISDKTQEALHLNEQPMNHLEVSQDTADGHESDKKVQSSLDELEAAIAGNNSDMGSGGRLFHCGDTSEEGANDLTWPNLDSSAVMKCSSGLHDVPGSLDYMEASRDGEPLYSADNEASLDDEQATNMFFNMEPTDDDVHHALNIDVDQSSKATNLTTSSSEKNHPSSLDDNYGSSLVSEEIPTSEAFDDGPDVQTLRTEPGDEAMMMSSGFESGDEVSLDAVTKVHKFQPKSISGRKEKKAKSVSFILPGASEAASVMGSFPEKMDPCFSQMMRDVHTKDPLLSSPVFDDHGDHQMNCPMLEEENTAQYMGLESFDTVLEPNSNAVQSVRKFQPKPRARMNKEKFNDSAASTGFMDVGYQQASQTQETDCLESLTSGTLEDSLVTPATALEQDVDIEAECNVGQDMKQHNEEVTFTSRSTESVRKLRKRTEKSSTCAEVVNDDDWDAIYQEDEARSDDDYQDADKPKKRTRKKSMAKTPESEKPVRRRKRTPEVPDSTTEKPPKKKLPHRTQRKRRQVNKTLLETPEEELNPRQLPIKDLIMLAEAKERISNKTAAGFGKSSLGQSLFWNNEDTLFGEDQEQNHEGDETNNIPETQRKLNYHSYMNRPRTVRWSKSETDLLYEAIREFGTNFAMIEQLFPNRTRHQVKLKFKNEERKNPMQVHDALSNRSKDHSLFKLVIEQLQIKKEQSSNQETQDDPASMSQDVSGKNEEERLELHKEEEENGCDQGPEVDVSKDELDSSTNGNDYDDVFQWDADYSLPEDMEKHTSWDF